MRKKIEDLFQRKQSYNSMHSLNTSIESIVVAARGAHHLLGQGRGLAVLFGGRWHHLAGGDREAEAGGAQQDGHSLPRDEVVRVMFMVGTAGTAALASPWTVAPATDGSAGTASGRDGWASGGGGGSTCCPGGAVSG